MRECFEKQFVDIKFSQNIRPTFSLRHPVEKKLYYAVFNEQFLVGQTSGQELQHFVEHKVIPKILMNPGKRIQISKWGDITVEEKV